MEYTNEEFSKALTIYSTLLSHKFIKKSQFTDLFDDYSNPVIKNILREVFEKSQKIRFLHDEEANEIHLLQEMDNTLFSYSNEELRKKFKVKNNSGLYLSLFSMMVLFSELFDSDEIIDYVKIEKWTTLVSEKIDKLKVMDTDELKQSSEENQVDLKSVKEYWDSLPLVKVNFKEIYKTTNNKTKLLIDVALFLEEEGLVYINKDVQQIIPTSKFKSVATDAYCNDVRKTKIMEMMKNL